MLPNPFVGPRPLSPGNPIFGRNREIAELASLLIANRLVLLLSPSGAGKSSLVNAGLIPELSAQFEVFPPARVNAELPPGSAANRYVASVLSSWKYQGTETSLCAAVPSSSKPPFLIFDQFEEIVRIDPNDTAGQGEFFRQLAALAAQPAVWLLVVIREDYLAPLLPWFAQLPSHLRSRFRLDFLTTDQAQLAIRETADAGGRSFAPQALSSLVSNLAAVQLQNPDGSFSPSAVPGAYIEPMHLQIVGRRLWDSMPDNDLSIDPEDVEKFGDINQALGDYYDNAVRTRAAGSPTRERAIREWFERSLITSSRTRGQVQFTVGKSGGLENSVIDTLLETHLVRAERRRGVTWYELSHDRLIEPVLLSNQAWFRDNLSDLQRLTTVWLDRDKIEGLLLSGTVLEEAAAWAAAHPDLVTPAEAEFLEKSRQRAEAAAREARLNRELTVALVHAALREAG